MRSAEQRVLAIGEVMIELARGADGRYTLGFGGDTFNTAVYMARAGLDVAYATRLGDDPYSAGVRALAVGEGVATDFMTQVPNRNSGLYLIETSPAGERSFHYWRERAPARELFDADGDAAALQSALRRASLVVFSGITLSLYAPPALDTFAGLLADAKSHGARIAMDGNFRPRGWSHDRVRARAVMQRFWRLADIALPTFDDEQALWGDADASATLARLRTLGIAEIVVKRGADGALVATDAGAQEVPCPARVVPLDTTAAGDSFNAAYLSARLAGAEPGAAAIAGHRLAALVIQHPGAIVPRAATAAAFAAARGSCGPKM